MAGIGVRLNKIFGRNTLTTNMIGFFYSTLVTVAPMFAIIINLVLMEYFLKFSTLGYAQRELFSCTILYTFIFSLLTASPFNAVLSRYISDVIYEERYQDILPCYHIGCSTGWMKDHKEDVEKLCADGKQTLFWASNFSI